MDNGRESIILDTYLVSRWDVCERAVACLGGSHFPASSAPSRIPSKKRATLFDSGKCSIPCSSISLPRQRVHERSDEGYSSCVRLVLVWIWGWSLCCCEDFGVGGRGRSDVGDDGVGVSGASGAAGVRVGGGGRRCAGGNRGGAASDSGGMIR